MPMVGPQLPPHLADKRKRDDSDEGGEEGEAERSSQSPDSAAKRPRMIGPAPPPAPLDERPTSSPQAKEDENDEGASNNNNSSSSRSSSSNTSDSDDNDDDDDDFGPALPTAAETKKASLGPQRPSATAAGPHYPQPATPSKRDEWMTMAPTSSDWSARIDPTKLKNRKFATGKTPSSAGTAAAASAAWHETPEQKQARLQRELMGVKDNAHAHGPSSIARPQSSAHDDHDEETTKKRMKEYNESRGPSLYEAHQQQKKQRQPGGKVNDDDDDDPSARPFDREKDIAGGLQINSTKRREMMQKASDFGSRFSSAKYL